MAPKHEPPPPEPPPQQNYEAPQNQVQESHPSTGFESPESTPGFNSYENAGSSQNHNSYENPEASAHSYGAPQSSFETSSNQMDSYSSEPSQGLNTSDYGQASTNDYNQPTTDSGMQASQDYQAPSYEPFGEAAPSFEPIPEPISPSNKNPLQDIVNFGNSETVGTALTYRLLIKGLDIVQHIEELRDVLSDSKLGLKFDELKSRIKNGQLLIEKIEASQAAVLAQRLRTLPVEMVWEQKIYD